MTTSIRNAACIVTLALASLVGAPALAAPVSSVNVGGVEQGSVEGAERFDAAVELEGTININTATATQLELLPGIGPSIAGRIVKYRERRSFKQIKNLQRVKGIGSKTYRKAKPYLSVEGETTLRVAGK